MRKLIISLLLVLLIISMGSYIFSVSFNKVRPKDKASTQNVHKNKRLERVGEKIIYNIKLGKFNLGNAVFSHLPETRLQGKQVRLTTFETKLVRFADLEKIYSDLDTFLPLRVERDISTWPFPEKITEDYDQKNFVLTIKKIKLNKKEESTVIKKDSVINNAILLPFYLRDKTNLAAGYSFTARLPNQEFLIELVTEEIVEVPAGKFKAYRFVSKPKKFEIWISADKRRIPVKIKGINGLGYMLVMKEYSL